MNKRVSFGNPKPSSSTQSVEADKWVENRATPPAQPTERMKRLTIDVPFTLHTRMKVTCAKRGTNMADEIRALLAQNYPTEV